MREIKFRGKSVLPIEELDQLDTRHENGWVTGSLITNAGNPFIVGDLADWDEEFIAHEFWAKVIPATVGQYTGVKDRDGVEIYEGDVIQTNALKENEFRWLVEPIGSEHADGGRYGICVSYYGDGDNQYLDDGILKGEIIGNIYENPELLEVAK
ncbi:YopX family protein [Sporosarcina sp. FA9]|uniref:YopX family protein n=1 Tax=Sporosarcina sp. FA9 TaxID=3413030 RepID=UPI003F658E10